VAGDELAPWLRALVEADLGDARAREAACLAGSAVQGRGELFAAREQIARCEGHLMVLDFHDLGETWERAEGKPLKQAEVLRIVVRQVGYGYRFRDGYQEAAWKP
jgi:hypothetical protein